MNDRALKSGFFRRSVCTILAILMALGPSLPALAQTNAAQQAVRQSVERAVPGAVNPEAPQPEFQPQPSQPPASPSDPSARKLDTQFIPGGAAAVIVLRPKQLLTSPLAQMLPTEVATAAGMQFVGVDPVDVDELMIFAEQFNPVAPPAYGAVVKFNKPFRASSLTPMVRPYAKLAQLGSKKYLQSANPLYPSFYGVNTQTMIVAPDDALRKLIEAPNPSASGPIIDRVRQAAWGSDLYIALDLASVTPLMQMSLMQVPPQAKDQALKALEVAKLISVVELTLNLSAPGPMSLVVHANDETAAQQLEAMLAEAVSKYQTGPPVEDPAMNGPIQQAMAQYRQRMSVFFQPQRSGTAITCFRMDGRENPGQQHFASVAVIGILTALLLPAVQAAREAARRAQGGGGDASINNMKQLALALLTFASAKAMLPPHAIYSQEGQPLLSWRVAILPFIEQQALYQQFKLDEPWDSEHNRSLIAQMPAVFKSPNAPLEPGKTNYLAVVGEPCAMNGTQQGVNFRQIRDGTSNTVSIVEANADQAVEWTKPDDLEFDPNNPMNGLGSAVPGGFNAAFADGSVKALRNLPPDTVKALFTSNGGEVIPANLQPPTESNPLGPPGAP